MVGAIRFRCSQGLVSGSGFAVASRKAEWMSDGKGAGEEGTAETRYKRGIPYLTGSASRWVPVHCTSCENVTGAAMLCTVRAILPL